MHGFRRIDLVLVLAVIAGTLAPARCIAGTLDPTQFNSIGTLALFTAGTYTIDTTGTVPTLVYGSQTFTGIVYNGTAVFDFSSINVASGVTLSALQGGIPVALLSQTTANIGGVISVSASGGEAGSGAAFSGAGSNGASGKDPLDPYPGPSGYYTTGGGGGGNQGSGGQGGGAFFPDGYMAVGAAGGSPYSNLGQILQGGGSGGLGGGLPGLPIHGGGGGGAIEIGSILSLTISGEIDAIGGSADSSGSGGGAGGGIFLQSNFVSLTGTLDVQGGNGYLGGVNSYTVSGGGGGGGGGQILVEYGQGGFSDAGVNLLLTGGQGGSGYNFGAGNGDAGANGLFQAVNVPEPSSLILLGTSALGLLGASIARQIHRPKAGLGI